MVKIRSRTPILAQGYLEIALPCALNPCVAKPNRNYPKPPHDRMWWCGVSAAVVALRLIFPQALRYGFYLGVELLATKTQG